MSDLARTLMIAGILLFLAGALLSLWGRIPGAGRLPGDFFMQKGNFSFYFPLTTSILISIILSAVLFLWAKR